MVGFFHVVGGVLLFLYVGNDLPLVLNICVVAVLIRVVGDDLCSAVGESDAIFTGSLVAVSGFLVREIVTRVAVFNRVTKSVMRWGLEEKNKEEEEDKKISTDSSHFGCCTKLLFTLLAARPFPEEVGLYWVTIISYDKFKLNLDHDHLI